MTAPRAMYVSMLSARPRARRGTDFTYLVSWPDGVWKAGYTGGDRWRTFVCRGATLRALWTFGQDAPLFAALDQEQHVEVALRRVGRAAFCSRLEAQHHLGSGGGGWRECVRLASDSLEELPVGLLRGSLAGIPRGIPTPEFLQRFHVRTDGRTDGEGS